MRLVDGDGPEALEPDSAEKRVAVLLARSAAAWQHGIRLSAPRGRRGTGPYPMVATPTRPTTAGPRRTNSDFRQERSSRFGRRDLFPGFLLGLSSCSSTQPLVAVGSRGLTAGRD